MNSAFYRLVRLALGKLLPLFILALLTGSRFGFAQDDLELLRNRVLEDKLRVSFSETEVRSLMSSLSPQGHWPSINYGDVSRIAFENRAHVVNIRDMSLAYRKEQSSLRGLPGVKIAIEKAIDFWLENDFIAANWHTNEIANPTTWIEVLYLLDEELSAERARGLSSLAARANLRAWGARPGGDLIKIAGLAAELALYRRDAAGFKESVDAMVAEVAVTSGMGIKPDLGFHHRSDRVTSILSYGTGYAATFADWGQRLDGTAYRFPEQSIRLLVDYYLDGMCKSMVHASFKDPGVINRDMSRDGALAPVGPELPLKLAAITDYRRFELENVVSIRQGAQPPNLSHNRFYWHSEYFSHQRPGYFASVRMHSSRNHNMEAPHNEESLKMHHYADGANFISRNGTEYFDIFPVWDWQKIPGTTVVQKPALPHWNQIVKAGKSDFVGAVSDGLFGAAVFDFESVHDPLRAKKAWFFFEDSYVCLGTDIYSESDFPVVTTLNQTLSRSDALIKTSKGIEVLTDGGKAIKEVMWVHQDSVGYQFHQPTTAQIHNQFKTGYWSNISNNLRAQRRPQVSKKVFSLWVDHGVKPVGDSYAYTVYPGIDAELMERVTASDQVRIIANTDQLQGVWHEGLGIAQLVFYKPGRANLPNGSWVSISTPGMVLVRLEGGEFSEITLSDPSREEKVVTLELGGRFVGNGPYWTASATNARTSVLQIKLPEGDQAGKSALVKNDGWEGQAIDFADLLKESKQRLPVATEGRRYIGEKFGGGVVVWLDETGTHGLIAADADQHMAISWRNGQVSVPQLYGDHGDRYVNAVGDGMYAGADNTLLIIAQQTSDNLSGNFAAKVCAACTDSGYGDWYLPSKEELSILFQSKGLLEGIEGDMYWSSSEYNIGFVWGQNFKGYGGWYPLTKGSRYAVRCVRRF